MFRKTKSVKKLPFREISQSIQYFFQIFLPTFTRALRTSFGIFKNKKKMYIFPVKQIVQFFFRYPNVSIMFLNVLDIFPELFDVSLEDF